MAGLDFDSLLALLFAGDCSADLAMDELSPWATPLHN